MNAATTSTEVLWGMDDIATRCGVAKATVRDWRAHNTLPPAIRIGGTLRWRPATIEAWLDAQTETPAGGDL